ncbi:MAG TPA: OmpA family protein, partial [bacterium]|nr:OmpA family protein [bacterium]
GAGALHLGLDAVDLASDLAWSNGSLQEQPASLRWAVAYEPWPDSWVSVQQDALDRAGLGAQAQWRVGLQAALPGSWFLRLGATGGDGLSPLGSAGLGWDPWFDGGRLSLDYAMLWPLQGGGTSALRHVADLAWRFGPRPHGVAILTAGILLRDQAARLYLVRLFLRPAEPDSRSWTLVLGSEGRELRRIEGSGPLPDSVDWDGHDGSGRSTKALALDWHLTVEGPAGVVDSAGHLALTEQGPLSPTASLARPRVELKRPDTLLVSEADFNVADVSGTAGASAWELRIVDAGGRAVRSIRGSGPVPKAVHWEGTDDMGAPAQVSLGATYELRVVDAAGSTRVALDAPVVDPASFAALASDARLEAGAWPSAMAVPRPHVLHCSFGFSRGSAELEPQALQVLAAAVKQAKAWGLDRCSAEGHADSEGSDELNQKLSSQRAAAVLQALVSAGLAVPAPQVKSYGDTVPAADNATAAGRAQNRRVELTVWGRPTGAGQGPMEGQDP